MDGEIIVKSPPTGANKGSEFTVMIPVKKLVTTEEVVGASNLKDSYLQKANNGKANQFAHSNKNGSKEKPLILLVFMRPGGLTKHPFSDNIYCCSPVPPPGGLGGS